MSWRRTHRQVTATRTKRRNEAGDGTRRSSSGCARSRCSPTAGGSGDFLCLALRRSRPGALRQFEAEAPGFQGAFPEARPPSRASRRASAAPPVTDGAARYAAGSVLALAALAFLFIAITPKGTADHRGRFPSSAGNDSTCLAGFGWHRDIHGQSVHAHLKWVISDTGRGSRPGPRYHRARGGAALAAPDRPNAHGDGSRRSPTAMSEGTCT